jgi:hypothetical protein
MAANNWKLDGSYFEACNCDVACPCVFTSAPTEGVCDALVAWHIDKGHFGNVNLDGLNIAIAVHSPGHMLEVKWNVAIYVDERTTEEQRQALFSIFSGEAGGHPAAIASFVGIILGVKTVAFDYRAEGKTRSLRLGDIGDMEIEAMAGQGGADVLVTNAPFCVSPGYPAVVAKSVQLNLKDTGLNWHITNKNGYYSPFSYSAS